MRKEYFQFLILTLVFPLLFMYVGTIRSFASSGGIEEQNNGTPANITSEYNSTPGRPFTVAEDYTKTAEFEDARNWYRMVMRDFPNDPLATEAAIRTCIIDLTLIQYDILLASTYTSVATEKIEEMGKYQSREFRLKYLSEVDNLFEEMKKAVDSFEGNVLELSIDYDNIIENKYLNTYFQELWVFTDVPDQSDLSDMDITEILASLSDAGVTVDLSSYLLMSKGEMQLKMLDDCKAFFLKGMYNSIVNEISTNKAIDIDKFRLTASSYFYHSKKLHERGEQELKELIEGISDPYSKTKYDAQQILDNKPAMDAWDDVIEAYIQMRVSEMVN